MPNIRKRSACDDSDVNTEFLTVSNIDQPLGDPEAHDGTITALSRHLSVTESVALPPNQGKRVMLNRSVPSFFHGKASSERPFCADCESPMILSRLEPDKPGFDLRTYACLMCAATESIVVAVP
jgi:hypothetical protein